MSLFDLDHSGVSALHIFVFPMLALHSETLHMQHGIQVITIPHTILLSSTIPA